MGTENNRLEMLFICSAERGKGIGKQLLKYGIEKFGIKEVTANEHNPQTVGFYKHMEFVTYKRTDYDEVTRPPKVRPKKSNFGGRYFYVKIQL